VKSSSTDVLVVGAGPAGLTAAVALAQLGVDCITISKYPSTAPSPRAHITNQRTVEVLRDLGLSEQLLAVATPNEYMANSVWATSLAGLELARLASWGTGADRTSDYASTSPCRMCNVPQHILEPVLREGAEAAQADLRFSTELISIEQDSQGVTAVVCSRDTGAESEIRAKYVIAADGARSLIAESLGFEFHGESGLGYAVNAWLGVDLTEYCEKRPGTLFWVNQPGSDYFVGAGTWINVRPWDEWVLTFMHGPDEQVDLSEAAVIERARNTIGRSDIPITVHNVGTWQINRLVAKRYRSGRVFLAGDAAHRHPPTNGLGANTSIQDTYNLSWKLALVLSGHAHPALLDTYDEERQPVGHEVVERAIQSVRDMSPIPAALGFRPGQSKDDGWASIEELRSPSEAGERRRRELAEAVELQNYQFNCHGVEMTQKYESSAVCDDGTPWPTPTRDPQLHYEPTSHPGARLPHAWLVQDGTEVSTLDLVGRGRFTILTGPGGEGWVKAAADLSSELGIEIGSHVLGWGAEVHDAYGTWATIREIDEDGCLLVRPDGYVAFRQRSAVPDPQSTMRVALRAVLRWSAGPEPAR
jgi:2,4-dichlorophenol 6-monooxygenase